MRRVALAVSVCLAAAGAASCRTGGGRPAPSAAASNGAPPAEVVAAEAALREGRPADAEEVLEAAGGVSPCALDRSWLLIELWRIRCAAERARVATDALGEDHASRVLEAHARRDPEERLRLVRPALGGPVAGWAHLETALAFADEGEHHEEIARHAASAAAFGPWYVRREALLLAGRDAIEDHRPSEALALAKRAAAVDPLDTRPHALASQASFRMGQLADATRSALEALVRQPRSARAARRVADLVREDPGRDVEADAKHAVQTLVGLPTAGGETLALYALLVDRAGDERAAIAGYRRALSLGANPIPVERRLRRLLFAAGERREALALLRRVAPPDVVRDPRNLLRGAWEAIDRASAEATDGPAPPAVLEALAEALVRVGAVEDALRVLDSAASPSGTTLSASGAARRTRLAAEVAFEKGIREAVDEGYRAKSQKKEPPTLADLLERIRALARERLPADEAAEVDRVGEGRRDVPFLGEWLDHSTDTASPLVARFRRLGKYLMVGQRSGSPPEAILLSLASITRRQEIRTQGRLFEHDVAVGYDREVRAYVDFQGGGLSGACLPDGVWFDADAARKEEHDVRASARVDAALSKRLDALAREAPEVDGIDGPFAMDDAACLSLRLVRAYVARVGDDPWGTFDVLRSHEFGHVLDIRRHLPVMHGLPATAALLASEGFSFQRVEARLEGRAQRAAMMDSRDPDLALAEMARSLPLSERTPEAHEWGYREQVAAIVRFVQANADAFLAIDVSRKILPQLDRLTPDQLRGIARSLGGVAGR